MIVSHSEGKVQRTVFGFPVTKKQVRQMVHTVKPLPVNIVTMGRGVPGSRYPAKCLSCRQPISQGERWQANDNGEYVVIQHVKCVG